MNILITGTSSGFGKLFVVGLAEAGHHVYATMRNVAGKNAAVAAELAKLDNVDVLELDVTKPDTIENAVAAVQKNGDSIDVVINNAGGGGLGVTESYSLEEVRWQYEVNVFGVFNVLKSVLPAMRTQKSGLIINVSSIMGRFTIPTSGMYSSSKYALESMSEALRYELKPFGIDVAVLQPGAFPTTDFGKNMGGFSPKDSDTAAQYGDLAKLPENFGKMLMDMVESGNFNDPQLVTDAVKNLIETPAGERPFRVVVDPMMEETINAFNETADALQMGAMKAFGLA